MSVREFEHWKVRYMENPFGAWRDNYHAGLIAASIYNAKRGKPPYVSATDFIFKTVDQARDEETDRVIGSLIAMSKPGVKDGR